MDDNSLTATVNYKEKEKFTSEEKFWFTLKDGKDAGKKKATKVILSVPLDLERIAAINTERRFVCFETAPAFYAAASERIRATQAAKSSGEKGV